MFPRSTSRALVVRTPTKAERMDANYSGNGGSRKVVGDAERVALELEEIASTAEHKLEEDVSIHYPRASPRVPSPQFDADIRGRLNKSLALDWVAANRTFFTTVEDPVNPGLYVMDAELIGLPLSHREAKTLYEICADLEEPTDGGGGIRTAFSILPNVVRFQNPAFERFVRDITANVVRDLGIMERAKWQGIRAKLQGLVLQPPCASNESFLLNTRAKNTFATMLIVLPTSHTGGDLNFSQGEKAWSYRTSDNSPFGCSIVAWLNSDLNVELSQIESGCRVMCVYDLYSAEKIDFPSAALTQNTELSLCNALRDLRKVPEASGKISGIFALLLKRTPKIGFPVLKTLAAGDRDLIEALQKICASTDTLFYLTNIKASITYQRIDDETERQDYRFKNVSLAEVVDLDDTQMCLYVNIDGSNILQDASDVVCWSHRNEMSYSEEQGSTFTGVAALFVVPDCYPPLLLNPENDGEINVPRWIEHLIRAAKTHPDSMARAQLRSACRYITAQYVAYEDKTKQFAEQPFDKEVMSMVIKASMTTGELDLSFNLKDLEWESRFQIGRFIATYGFPKVENSLTLGLAKLRHIRERRDVINEIETSVSAGTEKEDLATKRLMASWRKQQAIAALRDCVYKTGEDARCLILMAGRYGVQFLLSSIMDTVKSHLNCTCFILEFLNQLAPSSPLHRVPQDTVRSIHRELLPRILRDLWLGEKDPRHRLLYLPSEPAVQGSLHMPTRKQIVDLLVNCLEFGLDDELKTLTDHFLAEHAYRKEHGHKGDYDDIYLPFLIELYEAIKELHIMKAKRYEFRYTGLTYRKNAHVIRLFEKIITGHLMQLQSPDPPLPENPTNWVKAKKGCGDLACRDCRRLDRFLQDANKKKEEFKMQTSRRKHIEAQFGGVSYPENTHSHLGTSDTEYRFKHLTDPYPGVLIIEKTHQDFEDKINAWSQKCHLALLEIEVQLVEKGASDMLGDCIKAMEDLREMVRLKVLVSEAHLDIVLRQPGTYPRAVRERNV